MATEDPAALNAFLHRLLDDQESGRVQTLESYRALFPESASAIDREFARLVANDAADADSPFNEPSVIGPYRLIERLGQGSFGLVYRAEDTRLGRTVALKVLAHGGLGSEQERAIFEREAAIASRLDHPGICPVFEVARHGPWTCIAMRLVPGESLAARLCRTGGAPLPIAETLAILANTARALHAAHAAGVVHRDVKPGNIMVTPDGAPVVVDFGLARELADGNATVSRAGDVIGSPSYMAPEQLDRRLGAIDARTDVWALGVTLYECLAGVRPFDGATQAELFDRILRREPDSLRARLAGLGRDLDVVVATALQKEPTRRYQSARALADELQRVQRNEPILARPVGAPERLWRWSRRNPAVAMLSAAVFLALSGGLVTAGLLLARSERTLRDWERLADGRRLTDLQTRARDLWPAVPQKVPAMDAWLHAAEELLSRRMDHEQALAALRLRAQPATARTAEIERQRRAPEHADLAVIEQRLASLRHWHDTVAETRFDAATRPIHRQRIAAKIAENELSHRAMATLLQERQVFEFDDVREQLQHDELTKLVLGLRRLAGESGPGDSSSIPMYRKWREFAATLEQRTVGDHAVAWRSAIARILHNPRYAGLQIAPQVGLIPLGADPVSTLEEFGDVHTGALPERQDDGRLRITEDTAIVFVLLPGGTLQMGAQATDPAAANYDPMADEGEGPPHAVAIAPFFLSKYEMTQGQWRRLTNDNPSHNTAGEESGRGFVDERHPVEQVSQAECVATLQYRGLVLPTEPQWEYGCRAGTDTPWWCTRSELASCGNLADLAVSRMWPDWVKTDAALDDGFATHAPVGSFRANSFGLHDTIGNVAEWCADAAGSYAVADGSAATAVATSPAVGSREFLVRGGSSSTTPELARSACRTRFDRNGRSGSFGLRPARALEDAR